MRNQISRRLMVLHCAVFLLWGLAACANVEARTLTWQGSADSAWGDACWRDQASNMLTTFQSGDDVTIASGTTITLPVAPITIGKLSAPGATLIVPISKQTWPKEFATAYPLISWQSGSVLPSFKADGLHSSATSSMVKLTETALVVDKVDTSHLTNYVLLPTPQWYQRDAFNCFTPYRAPVGCGATMLAQAMYTWAWPHRIGDAYNHDNQNEQKSKSFFDGHDPLVWDLPRKYPATPTPTQRYQLGRVTHMIATIRTMNYEAGGSNSNYTPTSLFDYGYQMQQCYIRDGAPWSGSSLASWKRPLAEMKSIIKQSIFTERSPILVAVPAHWVVGVGWGEDALGRAFVGLNYGFGDVPYWYSLDVPIEAGTSHWSGLIINVLTGLCPKKTITFTPPTACQSPTAATIDWHLPEAYAADITGWTITAHPYEIPQTAADLTTLVEDFSQSKSINTLAHGIVDSDGFESITGTGASIVKGAFQDDAETIALRIDPCASGIYRTRNKLLITEQSVLSFGFLATALGGKIGADGKKNWFFRIQSSTDGVRWLDLVPETQYGDGNSPGTIENRLVTLKNLAGQCVYLRLFIHNRTGFGHENSKPYQVGVFFKDITIRDVIVPSTVATQTLTLPATARSATFSQLKAGHTYQLTATPSLRTQPPRPWIPQSTTLRTAGQGTTIKLDQQATPTNYTYDFSKLARYTKSDPHWFTEESWQIDHTESVMSRLYPKLLISPAQEGKRYVGSMTFHDEALTFTQDTKVTFTALALPSEAAYAKHDKIDLIVNGTRYKTFSMNPNGYGNSDENLQSYSTTLPADLQGKPVTIKLKPYCTSTDAPYKGRFGVQTLTFTNVMQAPGYATEPVTHVAKAPPQIIPIRATQNRQVSLDSTTGQGSLQLRIVDANPQDIKLSVTTSRPDILPASACSLSACDPDGNTTLTINQPANTQTTEKLPPLSYILTIHAQDPQGNHTAYDIPASYDLKNKAGFIFYLH